MQDNGRDAEHIEVDECTCGSSNSNNSNRDGVMETIFDTRSDPADLAANPETKNYSFDSKPEGALISNDLELKDNMLLQGFRLSEYHDLLEHFDSKVRPPAGCIGHRGIP